MDYSLLNFKHLLVVLNDKSIRTQLIKFIEKHEIDIKIKYVDSYYAAAIFLQNELSDPVDHILMSFEIQNQKFNDFVEFAHEYLQEHQGSFLELYEGELNTITLGENS